MSFRNYVKMFQETHHVIAIVKCLERSVQSSRLKDHETEQWYRPTKQEGTRSATTGRTDGRLDGHMLETILNGMHFRIEDTTEHLASIMEKNLYFATMIEHFLKPLVLVNGTFQILLVCENPIDLHMFLL